MSKFAVQVGILLVCVLGLFADAQSSIQGAKTLPGSPFANLFTSGIGYFSTFTPDGKYYLTEDRKTSSGSWINVWDVSTNRLVKEWKLKGESLWGGPVFSSDHSVFSIVTSEGNLTRGEVSLFDAKNWKEITTFVVLDGAGELDAHPFRSELLIAGNWDGAHRVNLTTRKIIATIPGQYKTARYSPDGQFIALGAQDLLHADNALLGIARVIRTDSQTEVLRIKGFPKEVSVAWKPDGKAIAMTSNNELRVVSIDGSTLFKYILTDKNEKQWFLGSPAWNRDGSVLAVGARFGRIILFDTQTWTLSLIAFTNCGCGAVSPHFSPDDKVVGAGSFLIRSPEGIVQATLNASADVRMGQQFRDQWLARIEPLCQSGQLTASACYKARTAIEEGHTSEYPDLLAFLLNEISLEEFLKRFNG